MTTKTPRNHGKTWTGEQNRMLRAEVGHNTPTRVIGLHMGRTPASIYSHASQIGVSLKPTNQRPYGTKGK